jgi:hypothetical protein
VRSSYDNAVAETFFATLKKELVNRRSWPSRLELQSAVFEYIEAFYNRHRRHSTLGMISPAEYEQTQTTTTSSKSNNQLPKQPRVVRTGAGPRRGRSHTGESRSVRRARAGREEYERRSHGREGSRGVGVDREARAEGRYGGEAVLTRYKLPVG